MNRGMKERERERQRQRIAQWKEKRAEHEEKSYEAAGPSGVLPPPSAPVRGSQWGALLGTASASAASPSAGAKSGSGMLTAADLENAASGSANEGRWWVGAACGTCVSSHTRGDMAVTDDERKWARQSERDALAGGGAGTKERFLKNAKAKPATLCAEYMHKNSRGELLDILVST